MLMCTGNLRDVVDYVEVVVYCLMSRIALRFWWGLNEDAWYASLLLVVVSLEYFSVWRYSSICDSRIQFRWLLNAKGIVALALCCLRWCSVRIVASDRFYKLNRMNRWCSYLGSARLVSRSNEWMEWSLLLKLELWSYGATLRRYNRLLSLLIVGWRNSTALSLSH
jgi:hypothetical protein